MERALTYEPMRVVVMALALIGICASCASGSEDGGAGDDSENFTAFAESYLGFAIEDGKENGLSDGAIAILQRASVKGELTPADLHDAIELTLECFDDAGIPYQRVAGVSLTGLPEESFTYAAPPGTEDGDMRWFDVADICQSANSMLITGLYENQPAAVSVREDWFDASRRDEVSQCLRDGGVTTSQADGFEEILSAAKTYLDQTGDSSCLDLLFD